MVISQAWRSWRSAKGVLFLAAAALAAGIGSATAIYTVVDGVMLKPLPYRNGERYVAVFGAATNDPEHYASLSSQDARAYQERTQSFDAFGWFRDAGKNLTFAGEPYHVRGVMVTLSLVRELGVPPIHGQWFNDDTGVVISSSLWQKLGADPGIIGKPLTLDGRSYTVTGVMPPAFHLPAAGIIEAGSRTDVWMALDPRESAGRLYFAYGRRRAGVAFAAAEADVKRVAAAIADEDTVNHPAYTARVFDLRETVIKEIRPTLLLLFAAAGLLFLITCANAAGLLLARSVERARETAIRVALGARRAQLAMHYFAESLLVSLAGAAGGIFLSVTLTRTIASMVSDYLPRSEEIGLDWRVLLFAFGAAIVASALSSLAPLLQAAHTAPADVLGEGVRASAGRRSRRISRSLVIAEIALAFSLLAVSAVLIIHLRNLSRTSPGFDADHVLTFGLSVPGAAVDDMEKRIALQRRLIEQLKTTPGADDVALANQLPLKGCCMGTRIYAEGRPSDFNASTRTSLMAVSPEYFRAMRIPLRGGRLFTDHGSGFCEGSSLGCARSGCRKALLGRPKSGRRLWEIQQSKRGPFSGYRRCWRCEERRAEQPDSAGSLHPELRSWSGVDELRDPLAEICSVVDTGHSSRCPQLRSGAADYGNGDDARNHPANDDARTSIVVDNCVFCRRCAAVGDVGSLRSGFLFRAAENC